MEYQASTTSDTQSVQRLSNYSNYTSSRSDRHVPQVLPYFEIYCSSLALLGLTAYVWAAVWLINGRARTHTRFVPGLLYIIFNMVSVALSVYVRLAIRDGRPVYNPTWMNHVWSGAQSMQDLCLAAYVFFWLAVVRRQVLGWKHVIIPLVAAGMLAMSLQLITGLHQDLRTDTDYAIQTRQLLLLAPPTVLLSFALVVGIYCMCKAFAAARPRSRDFQIVRWSSVTTLPLLVYNSVIKTVCIVFYLFMFPATTPGSDVVVDVVDVMSAFYGFVIFLVFVVLNVELLSLTPCLRSLLDCEDNQQDHFKDAANKPFTESEDPLTRDVIAGEVKGEGAAEIEPMNSKC